MPDVEELTIKMPGIGGEEIELNSSTWALESLDLGNPPARDVLVTSADAHGAIPSRMPLRENRDVTARVRLQDALDRDDVTSAIGELEAALETARRVAPTGPSDPIDYARLIYSPAGSSRSFFLPIYGGEITDIPKTLSGDDAGWFINFPVLTLNFTCDPFGHGDLRTYLDATTTSQRAPSLTVPGGPGDVPPWLRVKGKDVDSKVRSKVILAVKENESAATAEVLATAMTTTGYAGTIVSSYLSATVSAWAAIAKLPTQTRRGNFKLILADFSGYGQVRLSWAEAGGSRKRSSAIPTPYGVKGDRVVSLDINANADWDVWVEAVGLASIYSVLIVPTDSYLEVVSAGVSQQLAGELKVADALTNTAGTIHGTALDTGAGTWDTGATTWAETTLGATRTSVSMGVPLQAKAGTTTLTEVEMKGTLRATCGGGGGLLAGTAPIAGICPRFDTANDYLVAGLCPSGDGGSGVSYNAYPSLWLRDSGTWKLIWGGSKYPNALAPSLFPQFEFVVQIASDGRWFLTSRCTNWPQYYPLQTAFGSMAELIGGAKITSLHDFAPTAPAVTRVIHSVSARSLAGVTPPPIPSGQTLTWHGPKLLTQDGSAYPYIGASGLNIQQGVNNNLTVIARRGGDAYLTSAARNTDPLDIDIEGYPRYLSVPHG